LPTFPFSDHEWLTDGGHFGPETAAESRNALITGDFEKNWGVRKTFLDRRQHPAYNLFMFIFINMVNKSSFRKEVEFIEATSESISTYCFDCMVMREAWPEPAMAHTCSLTRRNRVNEETARESA
jgi:hypothetical protein